MKDQPIATEVIILLKKSIKRIYIEMIILLVAFMVSIVDSIIVRNKLINILNEIDFVEETTETYDMDAEDGSNYCIGGDNNGEIESN